MPSATLIVTLKLKEGVDPEEYERWARENDAPTARTLPSIEEWSLYRAQGLVGVDGEPPFDYVEVVQVADTEQMSKDMSGPEIGRLSEELAKYADAQYVLAERAV